MMQWADSNRSGYTNSSPPCKPEVPSTVNTTAVTTNNNGTDVNRSTTSLTSGHTAAAATEHLQFCLSMLPQSCSFCGVHPVQWGRDEVQQWLKWCMSEFSFTDIHVEKFAMNGKALILLKKEDFIERAPSAGDVLYNILHKLLETQNKTMAPISAASVSEHAAMLNFMMAANNPFFAHGLLPAFPPVPFPAGFQRTAPPLTPPAQCSPRDQTASTASNVSELSSNPPRQFARTHSESAVESKHNSYVSSADAALFGSHARKSEETKSLPLGTTLSNLSMVDSVIKPTNAFPIKKEEHMELISASPRAKSDCRLLWEFISKLLKDSNYTEYIKWENTSDYTFRIVNPAQLSRLWGIQKNRTNMTYEKLSRALRYYYRMDIIEKVPGRRLTYRFMRPPHEIKRGQRGAKPGVPRKSRSTDEETEELEEIEAMESIKSELSDDDNRLPSGEYGYFAKPDSHTDSSHPLDLVNHQRHSNMFGPPPTDLSIDTSVGAALPNPQPLMTQLNATRTNLSLTSVIKPELSDWTASSTNSRGDSPHLPGE